MSLTIGTATARPGEIVYGELPVLDLPTGGQERLPIIIAQGRGRAAEGPTLWLTANIHGPELAGLPVIHQILTADLVTRLRGTVIAVARMLRAHGDRSRTACSEHKDVGLHE